MTETARSPARVGALEWQQARELAFAAVVPLGVEQLALADAHGRVLLRDLAARLDIPHYDSSAMDGWAVAGSGPWLLVPGEEALRDGETRAIVTGGTIPRGADAVLRSEDARRDAQLLFFEGSGEPPRPGDHLRPAGEEARRGDILLRAGTVLNPGHLAVAAACAADTLGVARRPRVALVLTGGEVIERGVPAPGQVRDSFGPQLPALIDLLGGVVVSATRATDELDATVAALEQTAGACELVLTTGGTGTSDADHLRAALAALGAETLVPALALRPGGPTLCARMPDGRLVLCLPGNPLAAVTGLLVIGAPLLAAWTGRRLAAPRSVVLGADVDGHPRSTVMVPYRDTDGVAEASAWTGSAMMRGLADAEGLLVVPPAGLRAGARASALPLPWRSSR